MRLRSKLSNSDCLAIFCVSTLQCSSHKYLFVSSNQVIQDALEAISICNIFFISCLPPYLEVLTWKWSVVTIYAALFWIS